MLDGYRDLGLRISGAEGDLPADHDELVAAVESSEVPFTTLRLDPA